MSVLGSAEQYQICNPSQPVENRSTRIIDVAQLRGAAGDLHMSGLQNTTVQILDDASANMGIASVIEALGNSALLAKQPFNIAKALLPLEFLLHPE